MQIDMVSLGFHGKANYWIISCLGIPRIIASYIMLDKCFKIQFFLEEYAKGHSLSLLICNHLSRELVLQTRIFFLVGDPEKRWVYTKRTKISSLWFILWTHLFSGCRTTFLEKWSQIKRLTPRDHIAEPKIIHALCTCNHCQCLKWVVKFWIQCSSS